MRESEDKISNDEAWRSLRELLDIAPNTSVIQSVEALIRRDEVILDRRSEEDRKAWDSYVNAMLSASPGLSVETAIKHADRILRHRQWKFDHSQSLNLQEIATSILQACRDKDAMAAIMAATEVLQDNLYRFEMRLKETT